MTALSQPTAIDGYRWLKNDIIRGTYQPDEKLRMSLLTARYALGVGPLREALSTTGGGTAGHRGESKRLSRGVHVRGGTPRYF